MEVVDISSNFLLETTEQSRPFNNEDVVLGSDGSRGFNKNR